MTQKKVVGLVTLFLILNSACSLFHREARPPLPADHCTLPENAVITVGCTTSCNDRFIQAIQTVAKNLDYEVQVIALSDSGNPLPGTQKTRVDAILSPGGDDIEPKYYTQELPQKLQTEIQEDYARYGKTDDRGRARDAFEVQFLKNYFKDPSYQKIPMLGVCYGMQMLSVVSGIPLYVDIEKNIGVPARRLLTDVITFEEQSKLQKYFSGQTLTGRKNHHQALHFSYYLSNRAKFPGMQVTATSHDRKIAEVLEFSARDAIGVQFHPETSVPTTRDAVFTWFLESACRGKR